MRRPEPRVNADDPRFYDFYYPWDKRRPSGVYEARLPAKAVSCIESIACGWKRPDPRVDERRFLREMCDCKIARGWAEALGVHVSCAYKGEMTDDPNDEPRSGYLLKSGAIMRHFWVVIGDEQLIFDPTASQFHKGGLCQLGRRVDRGGISLDRYIVDGQPFVDVRPKTP